MPGFNLAPPPDKPQSALIGQLAKAVVISKFVGNVTPLLGVGDQSEPVVQSQAVGFSQLTKKHRVVFFHSLCAGRLHIHTFMCTNIEKVIFHNMSPLN